MTISDAVDTLYRFKRTRSKPSVLLLRQAPLGAIRGYTILLGNLGRVLSPLLVAILFDLTQSYQAGFVLIVLCYLIAAGAIYLAKRPVLTNLQ